MAGRQRRQREALNAAVALTGDPLAVSKKTELLPIDDARRSVAYVNRGRLSLAQAVRDISLFPGKGCEPTVNDRKRGEHPMIQMLYKMRDRYLELEALCDPETLNAQIKLLQGMAQLIESATTEAHKSSTEIQNMLHKAEEMAFKKKEHDDRMEILRAKYSGDSLDPTDAELEEAAAKQEPTEP